MPYNITDESQMAELGKKLQRWVREADTVHSNYTGEWNEIDKRMNTDYIPTGFSSTFGLNLAQANNPINPKSPTVKEFVQVNRMRPNHESVMGDFSASRRRLIITGRTPRDAGRAKVFKSMVEFVEDEEMLPEEIYFPTMDNAWSKGLHWIKVSFNPRAKKLRGKFEIEEVNTRDVLVDPRSRGTFFSGKRYLIHRMKYELTEAQKKFRVYPMFSPSNIGSDSEYDKPYNATELSTFDEFATVYQIFWKEKEYDFLLENGESAEQVTEDQFMELSRNPETADKVFVGEEREVFYWALWNPSHGLIHVEENDVPHENLVPLGDMFSDSRLYPLGDGIVYRNLQDLLDVLVTVFLENAKRGNLPIAEINETAWEQHGAAIQSALKHGGPAPGIKNIFYPQVINQALIGLIPMAISWIQDVAGKHGASLGEMPGRQIAKETVQTLIAKDRQSHGRKDVMLKWTLTKLAKVMVAYISKYMTDEDFIPTRDPSPHSASHIPINQTVDETEYMALMSMIYGIPENAPDFDEQIAKARAKFESENDVKPTKGMGYQVNGEVLSHKRIDEMKSQSGLTDEEFIEKFKPFPIEGQVQMYVINDLDAEEIDLNIKYDVDNDWQNDPEFKANIALLLNSRQAMSRLDMLKALNVPNAEEVIMRADEESQYIEMAKAIVANPDLFEMVKRAITSVGQPSGGNGQQPEAQTIEAGA